MEDGGGDRRRIKEIFPFGIRIVMMERSLQSRRTRTVNIGCQGNQYIHVRSKKEMLKVPYWWYFTKVNVAKVRKVR